MGGRRPEFLVSAIIEIFFVYVLAERTAQLLHTSIAMSVQVLVDGILDGKSDSHQRGVIACRRISCHTSVGMISLRIDLAERLVYDGECVEERVWTRWWRRVSEV